MFVDADETEIAPVLTKLQSRWGRKVALGSYPDWLSNYHRVRLVLDSDSQEQLEEARAQLLEELPKGSVVSLVTDPVSIATAEVYALANNGTGEGQREVEDKLMWRKCCMKRPPACHKYQKPSNDHRLLRNRM